MKTKFLFLILIFTFIFGSLLVVEEVQAQHPEDFDSAEAFNNAVGSGDTSIDNLERILTYSMRSLITSIK